MSRRVHRAAECYWLLGGRSDTDAPDHPDAGWLEGWAAAFEMFAHLLVSRLAAHGEDVALPDDPPAPDGAGLN
jgi:hypothetical protein